MIAIINSNRRVLCCLASLILMVGAAALASADEPTRLDVLYSDSLEQMELEAKILEVNLLDLYVIVGEQKVLLVEEEEAPPPVTRTKVTNRSGRTVGWKKLKPRQRVLVQGLQHPSGHIVALEISIIEKAKQRHQKRKG